MLGKIGAVLACLLPFAALADGEGFTIDARRFGSELRAGQSVLSPAVSARMASELDRLDRLSDRDAAARELRALEKDTAFSQTGLPGSYPTLLGPSVRFPNVYAPSDTISSPAVTRFLTGVPADGWR